MAGFPLKQVCLFSCIIIISGCASLNTDFECPQHKGVKCRSLEEVNTMVDEGYFDTSKNKNVSEISEDKFSYFSTAMNTTPAALSLTNGSQQGQRVWFAPFEDAEGHFHEASVIQLAKEGSDDKS